MVAPCMLFKASCLWHLSELTLCTAGHEEIDEDEEEEEEEEEEDEEDEEAYDEDESEMAGQMEVYNQAC